MVSLVRSSYLRRGWAILTLLAVAVLAAGCPRVLHLNYQPSTVFKGTGAVRVDTFKYSGDPTGLMKQREVQSGAKDPEALYLSQDIGVFFTNALKAELTRAGYVVQPDSERVVSGTIDQFFLEYVGEQDQRFQINATFSVARKDAQAFEESCRSDRQQTKDWMRSGVLIERGVRDCIDEFLRKAQAAGAL